MTSGVRAIFDAILSPPFVDRTCSAQAPSDEQSGRSDAASLASATGPLINSPSKASPRAAFAMRFSAATACSLTSARPSATSNLDNNRGTLARHSSPAWFAPSEATFAASTQHCRRMSWSVLRLSDWTINNARPCFNRCDVTGCVLIAASHRSAASNDKRSGAARSDGAPGRPQCLQIAMTVGSVDSCWPSKGGDRSNAISDSASSTGGRMASRLSSLTEHRAGASSGVFVAATSRQLRDTI